jgi:hypothetical protein
MSREDIAKAIEKDILPEYAKKAEAYTGPTTFEAKVAKEEPGIVDRVTGAIREFVSGPGSVMDKAPAGIPAPDQRLELGQGPISEATLRKARDIREGVARPEDQSAVVQRTAEALAAKKEPTLRGLVDQAMEPERIAEQAEAQRKKERDRRNPTLATISDYSKYYAGSIAGGTLAIPLGLEMGAEGAIRNVVSGEAFDATPVGKVFNLARSAFNDVLGIQSIQEQVKDKRAAQITVDRAMSSLPSIPGVQELATYGNSVRKDLQESVSEKSKSRLADTEITGNIFKGELNFGKNPNLYGYALQAAGVLGSLAPTIVTAIATRGNTAALGTVGFGMSAAEGADTAKEYLGKLTDEQLLEASPYYKAMVDRGVPVKEARQIVTDKAAENAAMLQGMIGAVGGRITGKLVTGAYDDILSRIGGKSLVGRVAAGTVGSGLEEGVQEVTEGLGADIGIRSQVTSKEIGEGSAANLILGALGGAGPGGVRGAVSKTPEQQIAAEINAGVAQAQPAGVNEAAIRALNPQTYDQTIVTPQQTVNRSAQIDALSQATSVDEAVNAAMNLAGTVEGGATYAPSQAPAAATPLAGATPTFGGLPIAPAVGAVTPQAELVTPTPELVTPEVTPVTAAVTPEVTPVTTAEDRGALPTLAPRPQRIQGKAVADLSDDDLRAVVENDAAPAITRRGAQIELDARAKEVEATTPEVAATTPEVAATAPRVDSIDRLPVGPGSIKPRVIAEDKPLYRETNTDGIAGLLREDKQFTPENMFVTDNKDIALGQGKNKGVLVEFRPNSLSGEENVKPMTGELAGREYKADISAPRAVQSITFTDPKELKAVRGLTGRTLMQEFDRSINDAGQTVFTRKPQTPTPEVSRETTESFIDIPADASTAALPDADSKPVGGVAAADRARETAQADLDRWAAAENKTAPVLNPAPAEEDAAVNQIANALNSQFGGRVYAFHDTQPDSVNGFALGGTAFVNTASPQINVANTSLHEFKHTVEQIAEAETRQGLTNTPAQQFTASIDSIFTDMTEEGKRAYSENFLHKEELDAIADPAAREQRLQELLQEPLLVSEMTADFLGNRATDKAFWRDVAKADPAGFKGFVDKWIGIIDNLLSRLQGRANQGSKEASKVDQYVRDLKKAKMVAREALIAYRRGTLQQAPAEAGTPAMSLREGEGREANIPGRGEGVQPSPERAGPAAGEDGRSDLPSYGEARDGAISVVGRHYSPRVQTSLSSAYYGTGLRGAEAGRLRESKDSRIGNRIYFYVDTGNGIRPESGVGRFAHEVRLNNIYDPATRLIPPQPNSNAFESAVIDAGFDGYIAPFGRGAAVVMLGPKHDYVPVKALETAPAFSKPQKGEEKPEPSKRQYKLELEKQERQIGEAAELSTEEQGAVLRDAAEFSIPEQQVIELLNQAREIKRQFPESAGWAPLKLIGLEVPETEEGKEPKPELKWQAIAYAFNRPPGTTRAPAKMDEAWAEKVADEFYKLVKDIYNRAAAGDKNAQIIISHQTWYRNVAEILRREYGAQGDLLADLLGATSPNTPVDTNWRFSVEILRRFVRGDFNKELAKFDQYIRDGGKVSKYPAEDKIRQISGKLYGMNSSNAQRALLDMWRIIEAGSAPKARNFALNLIGQSNMATIDVWAARMLRRAANLVKGADLRRIPPPAEQGVTGTWNAKATAVTGEFGFGADVMDKVSEKLKKDGIDVTPPDLQAIAWFAEKELWGQNRWTTVTGEGGSFEENIEAMPVERYVAGWSIQQGERVPDPTAVSTAQSRVLVMLTGDDSVVAARVMPTKGLYGGVVEESFDTEWTVEKGKHDPSMAMAEIAKLAQENEQYDIFVSRVVGPNEDNANARPGVEIYFRNAKALNAAMPVLEKFTAQGQDGFTMAVDPRAKVEDGYIGVRLQYVPEISARWDEDARKELLAEGGLERLLQEKFELLNDIAAEVSTMEGVAFASAQRYDTVVVGKENYDEYIDRAAAGRNRSGRGEVWFGQPVRQAVERAVARYEGKREQVSEGRVPAAGGELRPAFSTRQAQERGGEAARETPQVTPAGLESLFEGLNGRGLKRTRAQAAVNARPDAARLNYVQENFIDILSELEDSGKVKINCD